jgi:hypothetical protein
MYLGVRFWPLSSLMMLWNFDHLKSTWRTSPSGEEGFGWGWSSEAGYSVVSWLFVSGCITVAEADAAIMNFYAEYDVFDLGGTPHWAFGNEYIYVVWVLVA